MTPNQGLQQLKYSHQVQSGANIRPYIPTAYVQSGARIRLMYFLPVNFPHVPDQTHPVQVSQTNLFWGRETMWLVINHKQQPPAFRELSVLGQGAYRSETFLFHASLRHSN